ncbi:hypothetical protein DMUE_5552, partial [Dictyocoela muelleri]
IWVLGAVERSENRRIILKSCQKRNSDELLSFLKKYVNENSIIYTDKWRGYSKLSEHFSQHKTVNHSIEFVNMKNNVHINTIEGCWSGVKKEILRRHRAKDLIDIYLLFFMLNRNENNEFFKCFIDLIIN